MGRRWDDAFGGEDEGSSWELLEMRWEGQREAPWRVIRFCSWILYECNSLEVVLIWLFVYRYRKVEVYLPPVARSLVTIAYCAMIWTQRIEYVNCLKESAPRNAMGDAKL